MSKFISCRPAAVIATGFAVAVAVLILLVCIAFAGDLPNSSLTPGQADPALTKERLCSSSFRTGSVRNVTAATRAAAFKGYGVTCPKSGPKSCAKLYELDHLISLEIGGDNDVKNLWPEIYASQWGAHVKDKLENKLHKLVCAGTMSLQDAQHQISTDWISAYKEYMK